MKFSYLQKSCVILVFFLATVVSLSVYSSSRRIYAPPQQINIDKPYKAYDVWEQLGVKGRVVLLFDRHLNVDQEGSSVAESNYMHWAIAKNAVRAVYHVIPDNAWEEVKHNIQNIQVRDFSNGIYRSTIEGAPLYILRISDIPRLRDKVMMNINTDLYTEHEINEIKELLRSGKITADIITESGKTQQRF